MEQSLEAISVVSAGAAEGARFCFAEDRYEAGVWLLCGFSALCIFLNIPYRKLKANPQVVIATASHSFLLWVERLGVNFLVCTLAMFVTSFAGSFLRVFFVVV